MKACPHCGNPVKNSCYHDGWDYRAVEMTEERQQELVLESVEVAARQLESALGNVRRPERPAAFAEQQIGEQVYGTYSYALQAHRPPS